MAISKAHKLGQMIGEFIEKHFEDELESICKDRDLYLDVVGKQRKARSGKKVKWFDVFGSSHDLDFVIERHGTDEKLGVPAAIIECAWRRYTKHSKNKAQEIQGAVLPIAEKYKFHKPFLGAVVAGVFTAPSLEQLKSCGFETLYFEYTDLVKAFKLVGIDVSFGEDSDEVKTGLIINSLQKLNERQYKLVFDKIISLSKVKVDSFKNSLMRSLDRQVSRIIISPLYGANNIFESIDGALDFINAFDSSASSGEVRFQKLYIQVEYSNSDKISGEFSSTENALNFLKNTINLN